jgi:ribosomal protein S14
MAALHEIEEANKLQQDFKKLELERECQREAAIAGSLIGYTLRPVLQ